MRDVFKELRAFVPGINVAFSLFGSLSKGKKLRRGNIFSLRRENISTTDIDLFCFFDDDDLNREHEQLLKSNLAYAQTYKRYARKRSLRGAQRAALQAIIEEFVKSRLDFRLTTRAPLHLFVTPASLDEEEGYSLMSVVRRYEQYGLGGSQERVARFFHLDVGGGLRRYRQHFLAELTALPGDERERLWKLVRQCMTQVERPRGAPKTADKQFPSTYEEAVAYYGLPESEATQ